MLSEFALEVWIKYAIAAPIMIARFILRLYVPGRRDFDGTDVWCALATALYTIVSTCDYILSTPHYPTNIGLNTETAMQVPDEDIPLIERGSKISHFSWTMYICMIFSFKGVMLTLLRRVATDIDRQETVVKCAIGFTILSWVASVLAHLCACVPVERIWQVKPFPGPYCTTRPQNYYVAGVLNMLTDAIIIAIPMPMLWNLRIPLARKLALAALFGSGIFIIICTILRTYYVLGDSSNQYLAQLWASREGFVSMIVVSAPGIWPFFSKMGWFGSPQKQSYQSGSGIPGSSRRWMSSNNRSGGSRDPDGGYELTCRSKRNAEGLGDGESEEHIIGTNRTSKADEARDGMPIRVTTEYTIRVEREAPHQLPSREAVVRERVLGWSKNAL